MSLSKLKQIHVIIIGAFLCVAAAAALFFLLIKPQSEALAVETKRCEDAYMDPFAEKKAQEKLVEANLAVHLAQLNFNAEMKKRMPKLDFSDRGLGMTALWKEFGQTLGSVVSRFAYSDNQNIVFPILQSPLPPVNPNDPIFDQEVIELKLGVVVAQGKSFPRLMNNVARWNNCGRLIMVGPPALAGSSPRLLVGYSLTCYIFPTAKGGAKIPLAGTPGAAGAAGAAATSVPPGGFARGPSSAMPPGGRP
ncbi:MAG: hypothetical protein NT018_13370 [Armatimonadetes bacterium]|nr:hypothetical protein [Armatimonadota bacterium]